MSTVHTVHRRTPVHRPYTQIYSAHIHSTKSIYLQFNDVIFGCLPQDHAQNKTNKPNTIIKLYASLDSLYIYIIQSPCTNLNTKKEKQQKHTQIECTDLIQ